MYDLRNPQLMLIDNERSRDRSQFFGVNDTVILFVPLEPFT